MKKKTILTITILVLIIVIASILFLFNKNKNIRNDNELNFNNNNVTSRKNESDADGKIGDNFDTEKKLEEQQVKKEQEKSNNTNIIENKFTIPIVEFESRITKKPFGIYITPQNSPVQPEKFQGYHTGVDVEYEDIKDEVGVCNIYNGQVVLSRFVSGYGGVVIISHSIDGENILSLYGHLKPNSLKDLNSEVKKGDKIGILGESHSNETDYERKHLHLGIIKGSEINLRGYVSNESELNKWYNPVKFLKNN